MKIDINFKKGAFVEILGDSNVTDDYLIEFIDLDTSKVEYSDTLKINHWSEVSYHKNWLVRISSNNKILYERRKNDKFNCVAIEITSASLGDTIAWIPYAEEYRKKHNVDVYVSTFWNKLFVKSYPNLKFFEPSTLPINIDKKFVIDYYPLNLKNIFDNITVADYHTLPLQLIAPLYLGLPLVEIKPTVDIPESDKKITGKYVCVAMQSTAQCKYWNHPYGWERVFDFLSKNGYKIVIIDKHRSYGVFGSFNQAPKHKSVIDKTGDYPIEERISDIKNADFLIGVSSGLAWLSWAIGTPVVMISGFTKPWNEFVSNNTRIHNPDVCNGCWNDDTVPFDASNWLFCPQKKDFICTKSIQPKQVTDKIKEVFINKKEA